jgi:hypothetical protein
MRRKFSGARRWLVAASLTVLVGALSVVPASAATIKGCGTFEPFELFQHRACVYYSGSSHVTHTYTIRYLGPGTSSIWSGSQFIFDPPGDAIHVAGFCSPVQSNSYTTGQSRTFSCTTATAKGYRYWTQGTIMVAQPASLGPSDSVISAVITPVP